MIVRKIIFLSTLFLLMGFSINVNGQTENDFNRFFGWHFEFHATAKDTLLGKNFDEKLLDTLLERTKPDFIQVDSKGHPGYSSYPTEIGYSKQSFVKDPMGVWSAKTKQQDVDLYVHHSNFLDDKALKENPDWSMVNADGSRNVGTVSYQSDYFKELLVPQL